MANKMLIDASHPEETRVVVLRGNRVEEFDFEAANRKKWRGNISRGKVRRVEPSLQAAFVEYGGNRHGFLAFSEIHPDYYQIPVADRLALLEEEARQHRDEDDDDDKKRRSRRRRNRNEKRARPDASVSEAAPEGEHDSERPQDEASEAEAHAHEEATHDEAAQDHAASAEQRDVPPAEFQVTLADPSAEPAHHHEVLAVDPDV